MSQMQNTTEATARPPWTYRRTVGPKAVPVTVDDVKRAIRLSLDDPEHDDLLAGLVVAATGQVEHDTSLALMSQTWLYGRDAFPTIRYIDLPIRQVSGINSIKYLDQEDPQQQQTMPAEDYKLNLSRNTIDLVRNASWPTGVGGDIEVEFVAGYGDDPKLVPMELRQAILLQVGKWFVNPAMDMNDAASDKSYEMLVGRYMRSDYP